MATKFKSNPVVRETRFTFEGRPLVVTVYPDGVATIGVKGRKTTKWKINLVDSYFDSRYMDGRQGRSRKSFTRNGNTIQVREADAETAVLTPEPVLAGSPFDENW